MNQEKIGKFIAECRKEKKLTQEKLAEILGVTEKSISNWENGRNMPDLTLFKPLCEALGITINELLSGEVIDNKDYQNKFEENIINTINYNNNKNSKVKEIMGIILLILGILFVICGFAIFKSESSFSTIFIVLSAIFIYAGLIQITNRLKYLKRIIISSLGFITYLFVIFFVDYLAVLHSHVPPRLNYEKEYYDNMIIYKNPFYNVFRINKDTSMEYYLIDLKKEYDKDNVPISLFNRNKSGIDNIIKYKYKYFNNQNNTNSLIKDLPMGEYFKEAEYDNENSRLTINYELTDFGFDYNFKATFLYNIVSLFSLLDNLEYITINVSDFRGLEDITITIDRDTIYNNYYGFKYIIRNGIDKYYFNEFLEKKLNDYYFVVDTFKSLIIDNALAKTAKIESVIYKDENIEVLKTISDTDTLNKVLSILASSNAIPDGSLITLEGSNLLIYLYNSDNEIVLKLKLYGLTNCFGISGKEYCMDNKDEFYSYIN